MCSVKLPLVDSIMNISSGECTESKTVRIRPLKCKLRHIEPSCVSLGLSPLLSISKHIEYVYWANPMDSLSSHTKLCFIGFETGLLKHLSKNQRPISIFHLGVICLTFICFTTHLVNFINSVY